MKKIKKPMVPREERFLAVKAELVKLLRDPAALSAVRRFCLILWEGTPQGKSHHQDMGIYIQLVAREAFPELPLEAERERQEVREAARQNRRLRRLAAA
jgi:hypothetical protein